MPNQNIHAIDTTNKIDNKFSSSVDKSETIDKINENNINILHKFNNIFRKRSENTASEQQVNQHDIVKKLKKLFKS